MFIILSLLACGTCPEGQIKAPDGECRDQYVAPTTHEEALAALPPCETTSGTGELDLEAGCANGACTRSTYAEINAGTGVTGTCQFYSDDDYLSCEWPGDIHAHFSSNEDGVPAADDTCFGIYLRDDYLGSSSEGIGIGVSASCLVEVYGEPEEYDFGDGGSAGLVVTSLDYESPYAIFSLDDRGYIDHISLYEEGE